MAYLGRKMPTVWRSIEEAWTWIGQNVMLGRLNNVDEITLTISVATTTITDKRIGAETTLVLVPKTANASAEFGNGTIYIDTFAGGTAVIHHANNANADRTYRIAYLGG